jgi:protein gp37
MGKSKIEWTDAVWNPITGCSKVSEGCRNCYAERLWPRLRAMGNTVYVDRNFNDVACHHERLDQPLKWKKPRKIFVNSMSDLFHEDVPDIFIIDVLSVIAEASQHTFFILTKRPERMNEIFNHETIANDVWLQTSRGVNAEKSPWPLKNLWLGVTAENQQRADERIPVLLQIPAAVRFVSAEPMLGLVDLSSYLSRCSSCNAPINKNDSSWRWNGICWEHKCPGNHPQVGHFAANAGVDWVICGSETGPNRREACIEWIGDLCDQCEHAGVPFFLKQMEINGRMVKMPELDGKIWAQFPEVQYAS